MHVEGKEAEIFSQDMIGRSIIGCIDQPSGQILLLDDGHTIEISNDHLSANEGYWVWIGQWKPTDVLVNGEAVPSR